MLKSQRGAEHRRAPRAPISVIVRADTADGPKHYYSRNISCGGAFLLSEKPIEPDTHIRLELILPLIHTPVKVEAEVVWIQKSEPRGFAVRFLDLTDASRNLIRWVVERYLGSSDSLQACADGPASPGNQ